MLDLSNPCLHDACPSPNQPESNSRLVAGRGVCGHDAPTRPPRVTFLEAHRGRVRSALLLEGGGPRERCHVESLECEGARGQDRRLSGNKAAATTVFTTTPHQHQGIPAKHMHGTTFLILKSLGAIFFNNPPVKTSVRTTFTTTSNHPIQTYAWNNISSSEIFGGHPLQQPALKDF